MNELAVEYLPPHGLVPYAANARQHSAEQLRQIARSISEFGFVTAVVVDAQNRVIAGHGRLLAAKTLKLTRVPVVRITHLTETQLRAYRLADNKIAANATWDDGLLRVELDFLMSPEVNFDVDLTGFSTPEIDVLIGDAASAVSEPPLPDGFESMQLISQLGDIWQLGPHRVACGDSRDPALLAALMEGEKSAMVFTDPPYNVSIGGMVSGLGKHCHEEFKMASGEMSCAQFTAFLKESLSAALSTCAAEALIYVFMDWRHITELSEAYQALGLRLLNLAVWVKTNAGMGSLYRSQHELVFILKKGHASHANNVELGRHGRYRTNVWQYAGMNSFGKEREAALAVHPTVKPIALVMDAIKDVTAHGDIVFDGFLGSGTTVLAAHSTHRRGYGIELDPRYVDVCLSRWMALTGEQPIHVGTHQSFEQLRQARLSTVIPVESCA
jgi:DNA modification methylase